MTTRNLVDPATLPLIDQMPALDFEAQSLAEIRAFAAERYAMLPDPPLAGEAMWAPGRAGESDVPVLVFRPASPNPALGAVLHIHGGGMVMGSARMFRHGPAALAYALGVPVVSVDYRLAPEHPFPAPQEDCYAALMWLVEQAEGFGFDATRIVITGESAGGGLAAAVALMARDRGTPKLAGQVLTYPMLDHRTGSDGCRFKNPSTGEFVWTRSSNLFGWGALRGAYDPVDDRKGWFSPSLATDLSELPPTYLATGSLDLFYDEILDYASRLSAARVPVELHCYAGGVHGFNLVQEAEISGQFSRDLLAATSRLLSA